MSRYIEYIEQQDYESGIKEVATLKDAQSFITCVYSNNEELQTRYIDEYNISVIEDITRTEDIDDEDHYCDILKRAFEIAGYYVTICEETHDSELDKF